MKGLLLKDYYLTLKYCKIYLLIILLFIGLSFSSDHVFFLIYPVFLATIIPITLLANEENDKWNRYSLVLPYRNSLLVSEKYLFGICLQLPALFASAAAYAINQLLHGSFVWTQVLQTFGILFVCSSCTPILCLPFLFRLGAEKGRIAYIVCLTLIGVSYYSLLQSDKSIVLPRLAMPMIFAVVLLLYLLSWRLSILFYRKRKL